MFLLEIIDTVGFIPTVLICTLALLFTAYYSYISGSFSVYKEYYLPMTESGRFVKFNFICIGLGSKSRLRKDSKDPLFWDTILRMYWLNYYGSIPSHSLLNKDFDLDIIVTLANCKEFFIVIGPKGIDPVFPNIYNNKTYERESGGIEDAKEKVTH